MGHADESMTELYDKIKEDRGFRKIWAEKCEFGWIAASFTDGPKCAKNC